MRWEPLTPENVVAKLSVASEHAISDFKATYAATDPTKGFEIAKDVCAFANHLGGTIIVGVHEGTGARKGMIGTFAALTNPTPGDLVKAIDRAMRLYCSPQPSVNAITIDLDARQVETILGRAGEPATTVVAINVEPGLNTPYGCRSCSDECKECKTAGTTCSCRGKEIADAYRFPIRVIEGARFLRPDEIARVMNVAERRAMLDLQAIQGEESIAVWFNSGTSLQRGAMRCRIEKLDHEVSVVVLQLLRAASPVWYAEIPLAFVRAIWRSSAGWNIAIDGSAFDGPSDKREGFRPIGSSVR